MTLFDTDVIVWMLRGNKAAAEEINAATARAISAVSYMELLFGAHDARKVRAIRRTLEALAFRILPVTETNRAVAIMEQQALSVRLDSDDAMIFATALDLDIMLCSDNEKHFRQIEGLRTTVFRPA